MATTIGRCWGCNVVFRWPEGRDRRLRGAWCPRCGAKLQQTTHLARVPRSDETPFFGSDVARTKALELGRFRGIGPPAV